MWLTCDCHHHALQIEDGDEEDNVIYLSFWRYGHYNEGSWKRRLRHIWYILKHGHPYTDSLVFKYDSARDLADHIYEIVGSKVEA